MTKTDEDLLENSKVISETLIMMNDAIQHQMKTTTSSLTELALEIVNLVKMTNENQTGTETDDVDKSKMLNIIEEKLEEQIKTSTELNPPVIDIQKLNNLISSNDSETRSDISTLLTAMYSFTNNVQSQLIITAEQSYNQLLMMLVETVSKGSRS